MDDRGRGWAWPAVVAIVLLVLVVGCFLFHGDDDIVSLDLCFSLLVASITVPLLGRLLLGGWVVPYVPARVPNGALRILAPPPKSASLV